MLYDNDVYFHALLDQVGINYFPKTDYYYADSRALKKLINVVVSYETNRILNLMKNINEEKNR